MDNPAVAGLPSKRHSAIGRSRGSNTKFGDAARDESKKFEVASRIDECRYRVRETRESEEIRKETSESR